MAFPSSTNASVVLTHDELLTAQLPSSFEAARCSLSDRRQNGAGSNVGSDDSRANSDNEAATTANRATTTTLNTTMAWTKFLRWLVCFMTDDTDLVQSDGVMVGTRKTGTMQGDSMSRFLHCYGFPPCIEIIDAKMKERRTAAGSEQTAETRPAGHHLTAFTGATGWPFLTLYWFD